MYDSTAAYHPGRLRSRKPTSFSMSLVFPCGLPLMHKMPSSLALIAWWVGFPCGLYNLRVCEWQCSRIYCIHLIRRTGMQVRYVERSAKFKLVTWQYDTVGCRQVDTVTVNDMQIVDGSCPQWHITPSDTLSTRPHHDVQCSVTVMITQVSHLLHNREDVLPIGCHTSLLQSLPYEKRPILCTNQLCRSV